MKIPTVKSFLTSKGEAVATIAEWKKAELLELMPGLTNGDSVTELLVEKADEFVRVLRVRERKPRTPKAKVGRPRKVKDETKAE